MNLRFLTASIFLTAALAARADKADAYLKAQMREHRIPGLALRVLRNGKPIKTATYGLANIELGVPVTPKSVFEIGSDTKQFTAACILILQQEGKLSVNDPVTKYLKDAPADWNNILIRHLLSHTSGLKSYTGLDGFALTRHLTQKQFIDLIAKEPHEFAPGEAFKYCNTGFNLLGLIIENVSGENYWQFLREHILDPLGMTATTSRNPSIIVTNRVDGYEHSRHGLVNRDYDITDIFAAGAIVSTVEDLGKWNNSLDTNKILTDESKQQMWTRQKLNNGKETGYGFGWFISTVEGHKNLGHGGSTSGFSATIQRFPDDHLAVIILSNTDEEIATTLGKKVATLYW
ncbi:MAG TPA: serine hydrolase domain-containing protein [Verrucomicrobiae bacterium]|nr:serine hydrolase domain-containing protein [Verrucomicrobiae bacterium]